MANFQLEVKVLVSKSNICKHFNFGSKTFYDLLARGLPAVKVNNRWIVHVDQVEDFIRGLTVSGGGVGVKSAGKE